MTICRTILLAGLCAGPLLISITPAAAQAWHDPDEGKFFVRNLGPVNSASDDYAPFITPNGRWMYITSSRGKSADLYRSMRGDSGWSEPEYVTADGVNTKKDDGALSRIVPTEAQIHFLDDDVIQKLGTPSVGVMTSGKRNGGAGDADIFQVRFTADDSSFGTPEPLAALNSKYWDSQPSISPDGSFIIFSSARPNGFGEKDLYISMRDSAGNFTEPKNLGAQINTEGNEVSPFIDPDGRTLFFSSDGLKGYGGADIFISQRNAVGEWGPAQNLGPLINTEFNEMFFYGPNRDRCYFASDRPGGRGGFDIYEAGPNIFAPGYTSVGLSFQDTVNKKPLEGHLRVIETTYGKTISDRDIHAGGDVRLSLLSGQSYKLVFTPKEGHDTTFTISDLTEHTTEFKEIDYGMKRIPPPPVKETPVAAVPPAPEKPIIHEPVIKAPVQPKPVPPRVQPPVMPPSTAPVTARTDFNLQGLNVPLFVSGYYRLNTPEYLADLRQRQTNGDLKEKTYIANVATDNRSYSEYSKMSGRVETIVGAFYRKAVNDYFPGFMKNRKQNEALEMTVYGFADPRPILGTYNERAVAFLDRDGNSVTVAPGDALDNFKLGGLRAHYAVETLDAMFRKAAEQGHPEYQSLLDQGLIRWRAVSGSVDDITRGDNLAEKRRILLEFRRVEK